MTGRPRIASLEPVKFGRLELDRAPVTGDDQIDKLYVPGSGCPQEEAERPQPRSSSRAGPVHDRELLLGGRDRVRGNEVRVHERVGQIVAVIGLLDLVPKPIEQRQLPDSDSGQVVVEQFGRGGDLLARPPANER